MAKPLTEIFIDESEDLIKQLYHKFHRIYTCVSGRKVPGNPKDRKCTHKGERAAKKI